jgi:hypothetical protein
MQYELFGTWLLPHKRFEVPHHWLSMPTVWQASLMIQKYTASSV